MTQVLIATLRWSVGSEPLKTSPNEPAPICSRTWYLPKLRITPSIVLEAYRPHDMRGADGERASDWLVVRTTTGHWRVC